MNLNTENIIQLKYKDIKYLREKIYTEQNGICPILNEHINLEDTTLDHQHKLFKDQELIKDGNGLVRGVLSRKANSFEGKVFNAYRRLGLHKSSCTLPEILRNLADYLEKDNLPYIHPSEEPKKPKLKKSSYNKLVKEIHKDKPNKNIPKYTSNFTKTLEKLFIKYSIIPDFY